MDLSKYGIDVNALGGQPGTTPSTTTIPGLQNLQSMIGIITIASVVLGVIFMILYIVNIVQRIRADRAMIAMHKDIAAIKLLLEQQHSAGTPAVVPARADTPAPHTSHS